MIVPTNTESASIVLRSSHVVVVEVVSSEPSPWAPAHPGHKKRTVALELKLSRGVKGDLAEAPSGVAAVTVEQYARSSARVQDDLPGLWSSVPVEVGSRLVAFASTQDRALAKVVTEPACTTLVRESECQPDLDLVVQAEAGHEDLTKVITAASPKAASLGWIFPEYLFARFGASAHADPAARAALLGFLTSPTLSETARGKLLDAVIIDAGGEGVPPDYHHHVVRALFSLLGVAGAAPHHDNLIGTYLPSLTSADGSPGKPTAAQVFASSPAERAAAEQALKDYKGTSSTAALLAWLRR